MSLARDLMHLALVGRPDGVRARARRWLSGAPRSTAGEAARETVEVVRQVHTPDGFRPLFPASDLPAGEVAEAIVGGVPVAVCNVGGTFHAVSGVCPHAGGPIGDGTLEGHTVICPYHGWSFDVRDGACFVNADQPLATFPVQVIDGTICVKV